MKRVIIQIILIKDFKIMFKIYLIKNMTKNKRI